MIEKCRINKLPITQNKKLMSEWSHAKNDAAGIMPDTLLSGSHKRVWWLCAKCGYEWQSAVNKRAVVKHKCPACVGQALHEGYNDLSTRHPELAHEWDIKKNKLSPNGVIAGSMKKAWWKCRKCGYCWEAKICSRVNGRGCPACTNQIVWKNHNDLKSVFPDIAADWDTKRNDTGADGVVFGSSKKVWWRCKRCGHQWSATVVSRTAGGNGCPKCANRFQTSFQEQAVFYYISRYCPDAVNRGTDILDNKTELDIYIPSLKVGIEYDGQKWHSGKSALALEKRKYKQCKVAGITLCRIRESKVDNNTCDILIYCGYRQGKYGALDGAICQLFSVLKIEHEEDIDTARDSKAIYEQYYAYLKENSLASKFPEIAAEWDGIRNGTITPSMVFPRAGGKYWWKCKKCGYNWEARVADRTSKRRKGCPVCAGKVIWKGYNDLATKYPELIEKWNLKMNDGIKPDEVNPHSRKKVWWVDARGEEYELRICTEVQRCLKLRAETRRRRKVS